MFDLILITFEHFLLEVYNVGLPIELAQMLGLSSFKI